MDTIDQQLLNLIQQGIPLDPKPYHALAQQLGLAPEETVQRLKDLREQKYIRRIGAVLNPVKLGYKSKLYALEVSEDRFYQTAETVNQYQGVTHNYRRDHRLNMWFTLSTRSDDERQLILDEIRRVSGCARVYEFPSQQTFKLRVFFDMDGEAHGSQFGYA
ncbi:Lrp/AsnC family transcriptional regulator [Paenibacillus sp. CAA11]|uniref:siroheme decarboxylase subunit alpha n=1 Tax=Paenibacillus sp. CAA11 TaxID=1532905 RepID=UPI000D3915B3|nr:AsnC family transcriptional regulator [Paenibacillus sp. CAA11]AWB43874.1 Lrp/AsnC family transcriptional regulator [Paenibacillus sp. CAA11]